MPRVKRGTIANKKRRSILKQVKGFKWGRSHKERLAKEALLHAGVAMFRGRKENKRTNRGLGNIRINAAVRSQKEPLSYSKFINMLKIKNIDLNRKVLSELAQTHPQIFAQVVDTARK